MKKAEAGIGTLILFIALILVAAVAAGVLIQTSSSLQSKALATGSKAETQISTQVMFNVLFAQNGSDGNVEDFFVELKLAPGSDPIKLDDTLAELVLSNQSQNLRYNSTDATCIAPADTEYYDVQYLVQGPAYQSGYLQLGDTIMMCFTAARSIEENEQFQVQVIPRTGGLSQISAFTPEVMTTYKVDLWP